MADQKEQVQGVLVEILGQEYRIGGNPKEIHSVAEYVDRKMRSISDAHGGNLPKAQVAILAAMDITAELFRIMGERKVFTTKAHDSIDRLTKLVEERAKLSESGDEEQISPLERRLREQPVRLQDSSAVT
ncbi:MAG TPA: cell division protein ZapA [Candidatus Latescibacteria bacterium]|nr:cell division protein ZapA [Candidatus Latescibacterota bacterium]